MSEIPQHRLGDVERKVLTLHALSALGPCGNLQLIGFMQETDVMNYFDLQTALYDLRDAGQVARSPQAADDIYEITKAGEETLALFRHRIAESLLARVEKALPHWRQRVNQEREKSATIHHEGAQEYHVALQLTEQNMPLMRIDISLPTAELAARFRDRWGTRAQAIYDYIIDQLAKEEGEE